MFCYIYKTHGYCIENMTCLREAAVHVDNNIPENKLFVSYTDKSY